MKTTTEMAREAGIIDFRDAYSEQHVQAVLQDLKAFEALVRADEREQGQKWFDAVTAQHRAEILAEREACAAVCEAKHSDKRGHDAWGWMSEDYAAAIRARGNQ